VKKPALMMAIVFAFYALFGNGLSVWAGCKSDCLKQYESEVESCRSNNDDPEDSDSMRTCIDKALDQYNSCVDQCEDENETV